MNFCLVECVYGWKRFVVFFPALSFFGIATVKQERAKSVPGRQTHVCEGSEEEQRGWAMEREGESETDTTRLKTSAGAMELVGRVN